MLRVVVILLALTVVARADETSTGRELYSTTAAHYDDVVGHRNPLARLWDLSGNEEWTNLENSRKNLDESNKDFEDAIKENSAYQIHSKLQDLRNSSDGVERKIEEYSSASKSMVWKLGLGVAVLVLLLFGGGLMALVRRKRR